ncbi:hypothetical protein D3C72_1103000 [compost metagenome]
MQKHHRLPLEPPGLGQGDQPLHGLARIDRVQKQAVGARRQFQRLDHRPIDQAVSRPDIVAVGDHHLIRHPLGVAQQRRGLPRQLQDAGLLLLLQRPHPNAQHRDVRPHDRQAGHQTRMGARAAGRGDDAADRQIQLVGLDHDLTGAIDIAQGADRVRASARNDIGPPALRPHRLRRLLQFGDHVGPARHAADRRPIQPVQQDIAVLDIVGRRRAGPLLQDDLALQPMRRRRRRRLAHVVRLHRPLRHQGVGARLYGVAQQELQLARLVAPAGQAGAIVALDPEVDPQGLRQPRRGLQRGRQMRQSDARKAGQMHGRRLPFNNRG